MNIPKETTNDGGPAYPQVKTKWPSSNYHNTFSEGGMTLRDHFAGLAMQGLIALDAQLTIQVQCEEAYRYADAMLRARENGA